MSKATWEKLDTTGAAQSLRMFPEFFLPLIENLQFLISEYGFNEPVVKLVSREGWIRFNKQNAEIKIGYEPLSLPWGYVMRSKNEEAETSPLNELMDRYGFRINDDKYREYDEVRKTLSSIASPKAADDFARSAKPQLDRAVADYVKDIASFFRKHLMEILAEG